MVLIGRQHELAVLADALQRASAGETARLLIEGPLGSGTTSLLDELQTRLAGIPEVVMCRGRAYVPRSGLAYSALSDALGKVLTALPDDRLRRVVGPATADMARLLPDLADRLTALAAPPEEGPHAPDQVGARVQESLLGVIERLAVNGANGGSGTGGVVCLVLEDLEHADPGTRDFISALLRVGRRLPLALLLSYHPDEIHRSHPAWDFLRGLRGHPAVETVPIRLLTRDEVFSLVEQLIGGPPSLSLGAAIMEGSRGNPLIVTQLVAAQRKLEGLRLSDPLAEIIDALLDALSADAVRVLRVLAAIRRPIAETELLGLGLIEGHVTKNALTAALDSGLAVRTDDGLSIVHDLCSDPIEAQLLAPDHQALHAGLARMLEVSAAERAWHWEAALQPEEARTAHLAAAEAALSIEPGQTVLLHYQRAIELSNSDELADGSLLASAGAAAAAAGSFRRAASLIEQAIERRAGGRVERLVASSRTEDRIAVGSLSEQLGHYRRAAGDPVGGRRALEAAAALIPNDAGRPRALALAELAQQLMLDGEFERSAQIAEHARTIARSAHPPAVYELGHATCTLGVDMGWLGQIDRGLELLAEATDTAREAGRLDEMMRCYANRTTLLDLDSRMREAVQLRVEREALAHLHSPADDLRVEAVERPNGRAALDLALEAVDAAVTGADELL
jgi:tetratricopeptide (TPR) repeat protein